MGMILAALAFVMGYMAPRAQTCAVLAVGDLVHRRSAARFAGFFLASGCAALATLPLAWLSLPHLHLAPAMAVSPLVILGGCLFGLGAVVNGACAFGTLTRIVSGEGDYLFTLVGMAIGSAILWGARLPVIPHALGPNPIAMAGAAGGAALIGWALLVIAISLLLYRQGERLGPLAAMAGVGLAGGLLYGLHPRWGYGVVIDSLAMSGPPVMGMKIDMLLPGLVAATIAGGLSSSLIGGTFRPRPPGLRTAPLRVIGGLLMGSGGAMIPGGNDGLVLYSLPALIPAAFLAYGAMTLTIAACLKAGERLQLQTVRGER